MLIARNSYGTNVRLIFHSDAMLTKADTPGNNTSSNDVSESINTVKNILKNIPVNILKNIPVIFSRIF